MTYLDTSALIKRFVPEKGSPLVRALVRTDMIATAKIAYAEVYATLTRKKREGGLSEAHYGLVCREFELDWQSLIRVDLRDETLVLARDLIQRHPLRGFDAVHLASALDLRTEIREDITFVTADDRLLRAAQAEGLTVINPESAAARRR